MHNSKNYLKNNHLNVTHKHWTDLKINKIYTVTNSRMVDTQNGKSMILTLLNNGEVWAAKHLKIRILNNDTFYNP